MGELRQIERHSIFPTYEDIANNVREAMENRGFTQTEVAKEIGIERASLCSMLNCNNRSKVRRYISITLLVRIAYVLQEDVMVFLRKRSE